MFISFREYLENRIVENTDYNKISEIVNQLILEKGYVTPEDLHEGLYKNIDRFFTGIGNMGADVLDKTNDKLDAMGDSIGKGANFVGNSFRNVGTGLAKGAYGGVKGTIGDARRAMNWVGDKMDARQNKIELAKVTKLQKDLNEDPAFKQLPVQNQMILNAIFKKMMA